MGETAYNWKTAPECMRMPFVYPCKGMICRTRMLKEQHIPQESTTVPSLFLPISYCTIWLQVPDGCRMPSYHKAQELSFSTSNSVLDCK